MLYVRLPRYLALTAQEVTSSHLLWMPAEPPKPPEAHCWEQTPCEASLLFLSTTFVPGTHTRALLEFL